VWFQHDHDIDEKPEFLRIKRACGLDPLLVRGALSAWFEQVNKHGEFLLDGSNRGIMRGYSLIDLVDLIGVDVEFWQIVASEGWIEETSDGLIVPKFAERFGKLAAKQKRGTVDSNQPKRPRGRPRKIPHAQAEAVQPQREVTADRPLGRDVDGEIGTSLSGNGKVLSGPVSDESGRTEVHPRSVGIHQGSSGPTVEAVLLADAATGTGASGASAEIITEKPSSITAQRQNITETAGSITPERPTPQQQASQFDLLSVEDLTSCGTLLTWIQDCATKRNPLVLEDEFHRVRVVAAAIRATGKGVNTPLALFKSIIGKRRWTMLEPEDIKRAQTKLRTYEQLQQTRRAEYPTRATRPETRAAPVAIETQATSLDLVIAQIGNVPTDIPLTRDQQMAMARQWDSKRSKTG